MLDREYCIGEIRAAKEFLDRSTSTLSEEDASFAPAPGMLTAAQQLAHIARTVDWFVGALEGKGFDMDFERHMAESNAVESIAAARAWCDRSFAAAEKTLTNLTSEELAAPLPADGIMGGQPRSSVVGGIVDHTAHHRGALTVYARLVGKVPPMPYM